MKKLTYYGFYYLPSEHNKGKVYQELSGGKLYSRYKNDHDNPHNLGKYLYSPTGSEEYAANIKLPSKDIHFYTFNVWEIALQLDDFMECIEIGSRFGFFISPKVKDILSEYNLSAHKYYPVNIQFKSEVHKYFFLLISHESNSINYAKSTFVDAYDETEQVPVQKYDDLIELNTFEEDGSKYWATKDIEEQKIVFDHPIDLYSPVTLRSTSFYFSERLKKRLEDEGITGIKIYDDEDEDLEFYLDE